MTVPPRDPGHPLLTDAAIEAAARSNWAHTASADWPWNMVADVVKNGYRARAREDLEAFLAEVARDGNTITIWRCVGACGHCWLHKPFVLGGAHASADGECYGTIHEHACLVLDPVDTEETP